MQETRKMYKYFNGLFYCFVYNAKSVPAAKLYQIDFSIWIAEIAHSDATTRNPFAWLAPAMKRNQIN